MRVYPLSNNTKGFISSKDIKKGFGINNFCIVSTNVGLLTNIKAQNLNLGGKVILTL